MATRRRARTTSRRAVSRTRVQSRGRSRVRRTAAKRSTSRRPSRARASGGHRTVRIVIEHAQQPSAVARPELPTQGDPAPARKAKF